MLARKTRPADSCDIVVIGGGSAGCAMSARLADAGLRVELLEAGKSDADIRLHVPALTMAVVHNLDYDWGFPAEPDASVGGRADRWPAGKRLGGGSAINGMIYVRGHAPLSDHRAGSRHCASLRVLSFDVVAQSPLRCARPRPS